MSSTVSKKGWVVIPAPLRKKYNLRPGVEVQIVDYGGLLGVVPTMTNPIQQAAGMSKGQKSLTKALLAERQKENARSR